MSIQLPHEQNSCPHCAGVGPPLRLGCENQSAATVATRMKRRHKGSIIYFALYGLEDARLSRFDEIKSYSDAGQPQIQTNGTRKHRPWSMLDKAISLSFVSIQKTVTSLVSRIASELKRSFSTPSAHFNFRAVNEPRTVV